MADDAPQTQLREQVRELERRLNDTREELAAVKEQRPGTAKVLGLDTPMGRRQAMALGILGGGAGLGALTAASQPAQADAVAADVGTQADPWRTGFLAAINAGDGQQLTDWETGFNTHAATKATGYSTDGEHFIDVDTSVSGVTITLSTADTVLGHYIVIRQNGSNDVTIDTEGAQNIDGSGSKTLSHDGAMIILWSDGSDWFSNEFIDRVDAGTYSLGGDTYAQSVVASGQVALSSDTGVVDTGESATDATYRVALGVDDPNADVKLSATLFWDDSAGTYKVEITENLGGVDPTVNYDIIRTR